MFYTNAHGNGKIVCPVRSLLTLARAHGDGKIVCQIKATPSSRRMAVANHMLILMAIGDIVSLISSAPWPMRRAMAKLSAW